MTTQSYDIYFGETLCGTVWARSVQGDDEETFCVEARTKYNEVRESGLLAAAHRQGKDNVKKYLDFQKDKSWKSDFSKEENPDIRKIYEQVETRLRLFQNKRYR